MASTYEAFEFNVRLGYSAGAVLHLRVHAPDRARAWERVRQMHPRAVEAVGTKPAGTLFLLPDIYEQPAPSLDFNLTQGLTDNWKITFRGKNLLNPIFQRTQTFQGTEYTYSSYTKGWDVSLNAAYSF